ncbi:Putative protein C2orf54 [Chelonia mydas]|uniref:Uncharacterized protein n=1 Tax=Chelonia mydas TaxID=8469 RepID=M7AV67_CHEMY|nr:Putative protein C2orf54 [Chelonia mydas]
MDFRFIADYSRNLEAFEFALCTSENAVTVGFPLWIAADALCDLSAESLKEEGLQLSLLLSSGPKMIRFNIIPVVQRKQSALKLHNRRREGSFAEGSLQKVTFQVYHIQDKEQISALSNILSKAKKVVNDQS